MFKAFDGSCFEHALSKVCQYVIMDEKMAHGLSCTSINIVQIDIQKCNVLPKKFGKEGKNGKKIEHTCQDKLNVILFLFIITKF
jgi:hypothetical protein